MCKIPLQPLFIELGLSFSFWRMESSKKNLKKSHLESYLPFSDVQDSITTGFYTFETVFSLLTYGIVEKKNILDTSGLRFTFFSCPRFHNNKFLKIWNYIFPFHIWNRLKNIKRVKSGLIFTFFRCERFQNNWFLQIWDYLLPFHIWNRLKKVKKVISGLIVFFFRCARFHNNHFLLIWDCLFIFYEWNRLKKNQKSHLWAHSLLF